MTTELGPDAIQAPIGYAGAGDASTRLGRLQAEFAPMLRTKRVFVRHQGASHFVSGSADDTLLFPQAGLRSGQPRYEWTDRGDGVSLGRLIPPCAT